MNCACADLGAISYWFINCLSTEQGPLLTASVVMPVVSMSKAGASTVNHFWNSCRLGWLLCHLALPEPLAESVCVLVSCCCIFIGSTGEWKPLKAPFKLSLHSWMLFTVLELMVHLPTNSVSSGVPHSAFARSAPSLYQWPPLTIASISFLVTSPHGCLQIPASLFCISWSRSSQFQNLACSALPHVAMFISMVANENCGLHTPAKLSDSINFVRLNSYFNFVPQLEDTNCFKQKVRANKMKWLVTHDVL